MIAHYDLDNLDQLKDHENIELASLDSHDALRLLGNKSYATTSFSTVGLNNDLRVKVKREFYLKVAIDQLKLFKKKQEKLD